MPLTVCIEELTMKKPNQIRELYIGIMSGTSLDGVDTALTEIKDGHVRLIDHYDHPIPSDLKQRILDIAAGQQTNLHEVGEIDHQLGHLYADAVLELLFKSSHQAEQITAIGNHGQTVFHQPVGNFPFTMQLAMPILLQREQVSTPLLTFDAPIWRLVVRVHH